jgi:methylaspartate ammonia-lyase
MVHTNLRNMPKRLGQHAKTFARGVGTAVDKTIGTAHHYMKDMDPVVAGVIGGALGHDRAAITRVVARTKQNVASYEELRKGLVGPRAP